MGIKRYTIHWKMMLSEYGGMALAVAASNDGSEMPNNIATCCGASTNGKVKKTKQIAIKL